MVLFHSKIKGGDAQERLVYQIIEEANNKGIWTRDIRLRSNLPLNQLNKILKNLESRKLIKAVKSVGVSSLNYEPNKTLSDYLEIGPLQHTGLGDQDVCLSYQRSMTTLVHGVTWDNSTAC